MSKKLLPCPCCGNSKSVSLVDSSEVDRQDGVGDSFTVLCDCQHDGCGMSSGFRSTKKEARKLWNTRCPAVRS